MPLAKGRPTGSYPWGWGVYPWLGGENPTVGNIDDPHFLTTDVVTLLHAFVESTSLMGRGPVEERRSRAQDQAARAALVALDGMIDTNAATAVWEEALGAPNWSGQPIWIHGDFAAREPAARRRPAHRRHRLAACWGSAIPRVT